MIEDEGASTIATNLQSNSSLQEINLWGTLPSFPFYNSILTFYQIHIPLYLFLAPRSLLPLPLTHSFLGNKINMPGVKSILQMLQTNYTLQIVDLDSMYQRGAD